MKVKITIQSTVESTVDLPDTKEVLQDLVTMKIGKLPEQALSTAESKVLDVKTLSIEFVKE